jgi:hypothetical protein
MKPNETKTKFIEMRARGLSFESIATELEIGIATLYRWQRQLAAEIEMKTHAERERILEKFNLAENERLDKYCMLYKRISEQVDKDHLQIVPTHLLLRMMLALDRKISTVTTMPTGLDAEEFGGADEEV